MNVFILTLKAHDAIMGTLYEGSMNKAGEVVFESVAASLKPTWQANELTNSGRTFGWGLWFGCAR
jgi:hypothetical protein